MIDKTAPKLLPEFCLLVAGPGFTVNTELQLTREDLVLGLISTVCNIFKNETARATLIYGADASNRTILRILAGNNTVYNSWGSFIAEKLHLPMSVVQCGIDSACEFNPEIERKIALSPVVSDDLYLSQELLIQADSLRAFSDILLWLGDVSDTPINNSQLKLLRDTLLEGKPVIWLHEDNSLSIADYRLLDEPHRLLLNNQDSQLAIKSLFVDYDTRLLKDEIRFIANPLHSVSLKSCREPSLRALHQYFSDKAVSKFSQRFAGRLDKAFTGLINFIGLGKALFSSASESWYGVNVSADLIAIESHIQEPDNLRERFTWSDQLANVTAGYHRDVTWLLYSLSTLAVFSAVAGVIELGQLPSWFWPITELVSIIAILVSYGLSTRLNLHGKWLFHRFIAEQLRYTRLGFPLLTFQEPLLAPFRKVSGGKSMARISLISAETWLFKRTVVASGLPQLVNNSVYQPDKICTFLKDYVGGVINDQHKYHLDTYKTLHRLEHRLHGLTKWAFVSTVIAVSGHFVIHAEWLLIFTAALPALAAAIHGVITMNEMGRVGHLSNHTYHQLEHLAESITRLDQLNLDDARYFVQLRNITHESASVMSNVNRQWQDLIEFQSISLPA